MDNITEKIKKLLALSQSSNENEATAAAAKVTEMLTQYNLTLADLGGLTMEPIDEMTIEQSLKNVPWKMFLLQAIAQVNYCVAFSRSTRYGPVRAVVVGRPTNILIIQQLYEYLVTAVDRVTKEAITAYKAELSGKKPRTFANNFRKGCAIRIKERLEEQRRQMESEGIPATATTSAVDALVCCSLFERESSAIDTYLAHLGLVIGQKKSRVSGDGYTAGIEAGSRIGLDKQVRQSATAPRLPGLCQHEL